MNRFKKCMSFCTAVMMTVVYTASMCSCNLQEFFTGEKKEDNGGNATNMSSDGDITKAEWLDMVNEAFGIQADENKDDIENAKEWGLIKTDENVDPDSKLDKEFAARTLMMAGGFVDENATDEEIMQAAAEHGIIDGNTDLNNPQNAADSLNEAQHQWANKTFDYHEDVQFQENVKDFSETPEASKIDFIESENKVILPNSCAGSLKKDEVFILPPDENNKDGIAMKAINVIDNGDGTSTVISSPAKLEEIYQKIDVSGAFSPNVDDIEILDDNAKLTKGGIEQVAAQSDEPFSIQQLSYTSTYDEPQLQQLASLPSFTLEYPLCYDTTTASAKGWDFEKKDNELTAYVTFSDIQLNSDVDLDMHLFSAPDIDAYVSLNYTETYGIKSGSSFEASRDIFDSSDASKVAEENKKTCESTKEIARVPIQICTGISIDFVVSVVISANGYVSFEISYQHTKGFEMHNSQIQTINETSKGDPSIKLSGSLGFFLSLSLQLKVALIKDPIIKLELRIGPQFDGELTFYNDMACVNISMYLSASLSLGFHEVIQAITGVPTLSITLLDSSNTKHSATFHCEIRDGGIFVVDECTHGKTTTTTAPTTTQAISVGKLELEKAYYSIPVGTSSQLNIKSMPSDVSTGDLEWISSDTSKLTVDGNGNITALAEGSVMITVKTSDGKNSFNCSVTITAAKEVSFTPCSDTNCSLMAA